MPRVNTDKALGAMLGLAAGEAAGQGSAATQTALRLANALVDVGGYDPDHALRGYIAWYRTDPPGMSERMREVLGLVAAGQDSFRATSTFHFSGVSSAGNEAVARATPIGVAFAGRDAALRDASLADAALTHFDPLAGKVALLHNQVVGWLVTDGARRMYDELRNPEQLDDRIEDVVYPALTGVRSFAERLAASEPGAALTSIAIGLVTVFNADTFEQGLEWAVGLNADPAGDGAVTGALLGARFGASGLPEDALAQLERRAEIEGLAQRLAALAG